MEDLEQEKFCAGRCCFNMLDVYEMLLPIPKRGDKFSRKLEKMLPEDWQRKIMKTDKIFRIWHKEKASAFRSSFERLFGALSFILWMETAAYDQQITGPPENST